MGTDEAGTLVSLKAHRAELVDTCIADHNGRIVKTTGDGLLVEFGSVVDASWPPGHIINDTNGAWRVTGIAPDGANPTALD